MKETFGTMLRKKRMEKNQTTNFASISGISVSLITQLETDTLPPNEKTLSKILEVLSLSVTESEQMKALALNFVSCNKQQYEQISHGNLQDSRACVALRIANEMDFTQKEWSDFYRSLSYRGEGVILRG